ncbi:MAG: WYL domain-containing protein [Deltaproteobacteria bacterium]|nr:WYL domain-containing protein [Deltaproteobacteria bacterium]
MKNDSRIVRSIILSVLIAVFLTGCGDGSSNEGPSDDDKQLLKWLNKPDDPLRPQDYENRYFAELSHAIEAKKIVYLEYAGRKEITHRQVVPERLFRKGEHIYLDAFCLMRNQYRIFRLDQIKYLQVEEKKRDQVFD